MATQNNNTNVMSSHKTIASKVPKKLVPQLRFKEFEAEWKKIAIQQLTPSNEKYGIVDGPFGSNLKTIHYRNEGIPIITSGYVTDGYFKADEYLFVTQEKFNKEKRSAVNPGDIVMAKIGARCGSSAILPLYHERGILSGNALKITVDESRFSRNLIWQILYKLYKTKKLELLKTVGAQPAISIANLKKFKISVPTLPEQQKIAQFLTAVDSKLQQLNQKKELLAQYKKGVMQQLFSQQLRFKQEDGSDYPDWEEKKLGEVFKFKQGFQFPTEEQSEYKFEGSIEFIRIVNVTSDINDRRYVPNPGNEHHINESDLFMVRYGDAGRIAKGFNGIIANNMFRLLPIIKLDKLFYFYFLERLYPKIHTLSGSSTMPAIKFGTISNLKVPNPSIEEQQKIASYLSAIDSKIETVTQQIEATQQFKKGLLQQMFV